MVVVVVGRRLCVFGVMDPKKGVVAKKIVGRSSSRRYGLARAFLSRGFRHQERPIAQI